MTRPAENQQTVEAALDLVPWERGKTGDTLWSQRSAVEKDARAALRDLVAQAELAHEARPYMEKANSNAGPINDWLARLDGAR